MTQLNQTHDPNLASWLQSANADHTDFPIQNLPFALFRRQGSAESFRGGVAIGDQIIDLAMANQDKLFTGLAGEATAVAAQSSLNALMAMGQPVWSALRLALSQALQVDSTQAQQRELSACLIPQAEAEYAVPASIGDYTDFYTSIYHATNIGKLFRPDNPLLPNYQWLPIGYHGRSSSIRISGQDFLRPWGQTKAPAAEQPAFGPCQRLDYELEMGVFIGPGNALGEPINMKAAEQHVFGLCLLNDWSARDIQAWEYQPLGPFLAKNFATTISPWIVTLEALAPFRQSWSRPDDHPQPLTYLESAENRSHGAFDIQLEVLLESEQMRQQEQAPARLSLGNFQDAYWTVAQMVAHHTVNGCNLNPGDLFGSGTMSGSTADSAGALIELTQGGKSPITLVNSETRTFIEDGDAIIMRAWCESANAARIGFGEVRSKVLANHQQTS